MHLPTTLSMAMLFTMMTSAPSTMSYIDYIFYVGHFCDIVQQIVCCIPVLSFTTYLVKDF